MHTLSTSWQRPSLRFKLGLIISLCLSLVACSSSSTVDEETPKFTGFHQEQIERLRASGGLNEFETEVLADNWVSDTEWAEASSRYHSCLDDHDLEGIIVDGNQLSYGFTEAQQEEYVAKFPADAQSEALTQLMGIASDCADKSIALIGVFYFEPRSNPDGLELPDLFRSCLMNTDLADAITGLTDEDLFVYLDSLDFDKQPKDIQDCISSPSY